MSAMIRVLVAHYTTICFQSERGPPLSLLFRELSRQRECVGEREAEGRAETHPIISQSSCLLLRQSAQEIQTRGFAMLFKAIIQVNGKVASCTVFRIPESEKKIFLLPVEDSCVGTTFL